MKILCAVYNPAGDVTVIPAGDDVLLRNGGDFYIPDYSTRISCMPQMVVRICRLGKCVSERFADRYFEEVGVGIRFYADDWEERLRGRGLPDVAASTFDCSAAVSRLVPKGDRSGWRYDFRVNDRSVYGGETGNLPVSLEGLIALASECHTLKIGDFLFCGETFRWQTVKMGDRLRLDLNGERLLDCKVR